MRSESGGDHTWILWRWWRCTR